MRVDGRDDEDVGTERDDGSGGEADGVADGGDAQVRHGGTAGAEQDGRDVGVHLVDQPGGEERGGERRAALDEHVPDLALGELGQHLRGVVRPHVDQLAAGTAQAGVRREVAVADDDAQRLLPVQLAGGVARGERRVVDQRGAGADDDGVDLGPQVVRVVPRDLRGDPAARAVGGRDRGRPATWRASA